MQLTGQIVIHQVFGEGTVSACTDQIITVSFSSGVRNFLYPNAFQDFLTLKDPEFQKEVDHILQQEKEKEHKRHLAAEQKQEELAHLRAIKISPNGQAVFDIDNQDENDPFETGVLKTGVYCSGYSKGEPRVPERCKINTMCIVTKCPKGQPESERQIIGVGMVESHFDGAESEDGSVPVHKEYRLKLQEPLKLWPYMGKKQPKTAWGHTAFKYVSNQVGKTILNDVCRQMQATDQAQLADRFYQYYCSWNRLNA